MTRRVGSLCLGLTLALAAGAHGSPLLRAATRLVAKQTGRPVGTPILGWSAPGHEVRAPLHPSTPTPLTRTRVICRAPRASLPLTGCRATPLYLLIVPFLVMVVSCPCGVRVTDNRPGGYHGEWAGPVQTESPVSFKTHKSMLNAAGTLHTRGTRTARSTRPHPVLHFRAWAWKVRGGGACLRPVLHAACCLRGCRPVCAAPTR
jgi:hypothetical protein